MSERRPLPPLRPVDTMAMVYTEGVEGTKVVGVAVGGMVLWTEVVGV